MKKMHICCLLVLFFTLSIQILQAQVCFSNAETYLVGGESQNLETGDFNNDGYPDIAVVRKTCLLYTSPSPRDS